MPQFQVRVPTSDTRNIGGGGRAGSPGGLRVSANPADFGSNFSAQVTRAGAQQSNLALQGERDNNQLQASLALVGFQESISPKMAALFATKGTDALEVQKQGAEIMEEQFQSSGVGLGGAGLAQYQLSARRHAMTLDRQLLNHQLAAEDVVMIQAEGAEVEAEIDKAVRDRGTIEAVYDDAGKIVDVKAPGTDAFTGSMKEIRLRGTSSRKPKVAADQTNLEDSTKLHRQVIEGLVQDGAGIKADVYFEKYKPEIIASQHDEIKRASKKQADNERVYQFFDEIRTALPEGTEDDWLKRARDSNVVPTEYRSDVVSLLLNENRRQVKVKADAVALRDTGIERQISQLLQIQPGRTTPTADAARQVHMLAGAMSDTDSADAQLNLLRAAMNGEHVIGDDNIQNQWLALGSSTNRADRKRFMSVNWNVAQPGVSENFRKTLLKQFEDNKAGIENTMNQAMDAARQLWEKENKRAFPKGTGGDAEDARDFQSRIALAMQQPVERMLESESRTRDSITPGEMLSLATLTRASTVPVEGLVSNSEAYAFEIDLGERDQFGNVLRARDDATLEDVYGGLTDDERAWAALYLDEIELLDIQSKSPASIQNWQRRPSGYEDADIGEAWVQMRRQRVYNRGRPWQPNETIRPARVVSQVPPGPLQSFLERDVTGREAFAEVDRGVSKGLRAGGEAVKRAALAYRDTLVSDFETGVGRAQRRTQTLRRELDEIRRRESE